MAKNVAIVQFSYRKNGNCAAISEHIAAYYSAHNITRIKADNSIVQSCNQCDYECLQPRLECPHLRGQFQNMMDIMCAADLVYFIVPNYCGYPCANYFAFNERSVSYFHMNRDLLQRYMAIPKRFVAVSNTETQNFVEAFKQQTNAEPEILYLKTSKYHKRSISGDMLESDEAKIDLDRFLMADPI